MKHEATADVAFVNRLEKALAMPGVLERPEVRQRINVITLAATLKSIEQLASPDDEALCERLERKAEAYSSSARSAMEAKSLRQPGNTEGRTDLYTWPKPEETIYSKAAARIRQLSAQVKALEAEQPQASVFA